MSTDRACEHHQMQLSALLDDELEPRAMRATLDHLLDCPECARFYLEARGLQEIAERLAPQAVLPAASDAVRTTRAAWLRPAPAWGWAAAVVVAVAAGVLSADHWSSPRVHEEIPNAAAEAPLVIDVDDRTEPMNEARFVELTVELLRADQRYQQEMSTVLRQVARLRAEDGGDAL